MRVWASEFQEYKLPTAHDEQGNPLPRRKSCHVCTQCVASWRGNFSVPMACTTCPLIFCSRCLFHIRGAEDIETVYDWIEEHQGNWVCFMCTGTCACQDPKLAGLSRIDRHKCRGWVGVTGGFTPNQLRPTCRGDGGSGGASRARLPKDQEAGPAAADPPEGGTEAQRAEEPAPAAEGGAAPTTPDAPARKPGRPRKASAATPSGEDLVGRRVKCWWDVERCWFFGALESYDPETNEHLVRYQDGDDERIILPDDTVVLL